MIRSIIHTAAMLALISTVAACAASPLEHTHGNLVYTQVGIWVQGDKHATTNYGRGWFIPVNTKVVIEDTNDRAIVFRIPEPATDVERVRIMNVPKYSKEDIHGIHDRYFGDSRVSLEEFSQLETRAIRDGKIVEGMRRSAVLVARGYPPAHQTPSLEDDQWTFWHHKWGRHIVHFENDRVASIEK